MDHRSKLVKYEELQRSQNENEELLIFGYSCKLFRDDDKALYIDNGDHLIPWMDDTSLMMDRFDVRGTVYDLSFVESSGDGSKNVLTDAEMKIEQMCDQERYFALYHDEIQYQTYLEEEMKRLQVELNSGSSDFNQIGFNYDADASSEQQHQSSETATPIVAEPVKYNPSQDEEVFMPTDELNIPYGMELPKSMKQHKIILKTARFVATEGAQMEIVIKTKQAGNVMFAFLSFDNPLNAYYKHLVTLIRNGKITSEEKPSTEQQDSYLHPTLSQNAKPPDLTPDITSSPSRPSPNCPYSKLTSKIRETRIITNAGDSETTPVTATATTQNVKAQPASFTGLVDYPSFGHATGDYTDEEDGDCQRGSVTLRETAVHDYSHINWPPPQTQMVIDKMACYITKNGPEFEESVKNRNDPRMGFLLKSHKYHDYYKYKLELYTEVYGDIFSDPQKLQEWSQNHRWPKSSFKSENNSNTNGSRAISFAIKSREQEPAVTLHTSFPIESSSSEEDEDMDELERAKKRRQREKRRAERKKKADKEKKDREEFLRKERLKKEDLHKKKEPEVDSASYEDLYDIFKYAQEMEKEKGRNCASSRRELKREQRKKKAAQFVSKLKVTDDDSATPVYGPQLPPDFVHENAKDTDYDSSSSRSSADAENVSQRSTPVRQPPQTSPPRPSQNSSPPQGISEFLEEHSTNERMDKIEDVNGICPEMTSKPTENKSQSLTEMVLNCLGSEDDDSPQNESPAQRSRVRKKAKAKRSVSRSPTPKKSRKKRRKTQTDYKRKKRRSRSRSRHRSSKSHRSKKRSRKHRSRHDKDKSKKKKKRRKESRSPSLPSSQFSTSGPSSLSSQPNSDMDVQVIESDDDVQVEKKVSRESSVVSLPSVASAKSKPLKAVRTKDTTPVIEETASETSHLASILPSKSLREIFPATETSNSSDGTPDSEKKPIFNANASSAMAKITQGLRAKLNALLEKESKLE